MLIFSKISKFNKWIALGELVYLLSSPSPFAHSTEYRAEVFEFNKYPSLCDDSVNHCYTIEDLVERAMEFGLDSRQKIQMLFQARAMAKIKLGSALPQINLIGVTSSAIERNISIESILPFVGFLFPSRWFEYKAQKRLSLAEAQSLNTLLADAAQAIQHLYFDIQMQVWAIRILHFYVEELDKLIAALKTQSTRIVDQADIAIMENMKGEIMYELAFIDGLSSLLPQVATAIGLDPDFDWSLLKVEPHSVDFMGKMTQRHYQEFWPDALERSTELKNIDHLLDAAKQSKQGIYFDTLDPSSGNDLGFGYGYRIKIARSNMKVLNIVRERTKMQLSNAIQNALNDYNDSVYAFPAIEIGLKNLPFIRDAVEQNVNNIDSILDIMKIIRHFKYAKEQAIRYIHSYFVFKKAEADLDRYTWNGKIYNLVKLYQTKRLPEVLQKTKASYSLRNTIKKKLKKSSR